MAAWWARGGLEVPAGDREFVQAFAEGSPGMATRAVRHGIAAWHAELSPLLDGVESGDWHAGLADRMAELADTLATSIVDEDEHASKEAANRLAVRLMVRLLGMRVRRGLHAAAGDPSALARWLSLSEALAEFEHHVRANLNVKHAFANLVAQWAERAAVPAGGSPRGR